MKNWEDKLQIQQPRHELKARIEPQFLDNVYAQIQNSSFLFFEEYPERQVNSIYFDDNSLSNFADNLAGINARIKVRLRWYGSDIKNIHEPTLEFKIKKNSYGWKNNYQIKGSFDLRTISWATLFNEVEKQLPQDKFADFFSFYPVVSSIISYKREYYKSQDQKIRLTVDKQVSYYDQYLHSMPNINHCLIEDDTIVEIKAAEKDQELLSKCTNEFQFRIGKNSKYVNALLSSIHT
ncbi:MAG: hypothetical protein CL674_16340 [Bdellovibrionaceae bacterium]|nr:hypothetical protein [Pseudobdellovibrionaceae bacterium]